MSRLAIASVQAPPGLCTLPRFSVVTPVLGAPAAEGGGPYRRCKAFELNEILNCDHKGTLSRLHWVAHCLAHCLTRTISRTLPRTLSLTLSRALCRTLSIR